MVKLLSAKKGLDEIWIISRNEEKLKKIQKRYGEKIVVYPMDLSSLENIKTFGENPSLKNCNIRYLINNAGFAKFCSYDDISIDESINMIDLNISGVVAMGLVCIPHMKKGSHILNIASQASFQPLPYQNIYSSTKAFVRNYTRALNVELREKEGEMLTPTINLNQLYEAYKAQPGVTMETVCRKIADIVIEAPIQVDLKAIFNYEDVKDKLFIRVSSAEANKEVLENAPHQLKEDLAITYHVAVGKDHDGLSSMFIKNDLLEQYGISVEQLHEDAMKSSPRVMAPEVSSIGALIDEMYQKNILMLTPDEREMLQETLQESSEMPTFFVVTNTERIDGAGVIFYPEFMDNMGELLGNDFFILPSSIHEMLVLPDDGQVDAEMLRDMVKEVNATQVAPAERLTNDVYHFDTKDHVFEKADRFTERQKEKEAQVAKTEKVEKEQPDQKPKTKKHDMEL